MVSTKLQRGVLGENVAVDYLRANGFMICARNWRQGRYEIDIVAQKLGVTHFVEVKTRSAISLTTPEQAITPQKAMAMRRAAEAYIAQYRTVGEVAFDLVAVDIFPDNMYDVRYIENAIEIGW